MCTLEQEMMINISGFQGAIDDEYYRYRMPNLESIQTKKKTHLPNILEVSKALHQSKAPRPEEIVRFFALELGTRGTCPPVEALRKLTKDPTAGASLAGAHDSATLQAILAEYIENFVLCGVCRHPVSKHKVKKNEDVVLRCGGCGAITSVPLEHKLCKFIVKQNKARKAMKNSRQDR